MRFTIPTATVMLGLGNDRQQCICIFAQYGRATIEIARCCSTFDISGAQLVTFRERTTKCGLRNDMTYTVHVIRMNLVRNNGAIADDPYGSCTVRELMSNQVYAKGTRRPNYGG